MKNINSLYDTSAALQVLGCCMNNPDLLNSPDKYEFIDTDFVTDIHRIIFGAMLNLARMGSEDISPKSLEIYLKDRPESYGKWISADGAKICSEVKNNADISNFDYYYNRLKKFALLRAYEDVGIDTSIYFDINNILDAKRRQTEQAKLDACSIEEVAEVFEGVLNRIREVHVENMVDDESQMIGDGLSDLLNRLQQEPVAGLPLYGGLNPKLDYVNTATRGARLGTLYLRSAATGVGNIRGIFK